MKRVNIYELKAHLSSCVAEARAGETIVVCDRATPVARLGPLDEPADDFRIEPARAPRSTLRGLRPVRLRKPRDVVADLREDRESG